MIDLPETLAGHWTSAEGRKMAQEYAGRPRSQLGKSSLSDLELANAIFMADRRDLDLIVYQTAAKERIRWLSVQLALAKMESAKRGEALREIVAARPGWRAAAAAALAAMDEPA